MNDKELKRLDSVGRKGKFRYSVLFSLIVRCPAVTLI